MTIGLGRHRWMHGRMVFGWCVGVLVGIELNYLHDITCIHTLYIDIPLHSILLMTARLTKSAMCYPADIPNLAF